MKETLTYKTQHMPDKKCAYLFCFKEGGKPFFFQISNFEFR